MASGDPIAVLSDGNAMPPVANGPSLGLIEAVVTTDDNSLIRVLDFDADTVEYTDYKVWMPDSYSGLGVTFSIKWSAGANANECEWSVGIRRVGDDIEDLDTTSHLYVYRSVTATAPSAIGEVAYDEIAFTDGTQMDDWDAGEYAIIRVERTATPSPPDDLAAVARLHLIDIRET